MKKKKCILIIFIFSILMMLAVATTDGYIKGHDTDFHVANISSIASQLSIDNLTVQEPLKNIANNFGYGTRFFYPPIPHLTGAYIAKFLTFFNISNAVTLGMRITQWLTFFASGVTFFYLTLKIFKNEKIATLCSLFYMTTPYHLSEVFIRDAFSEMFIPIAIPLILLGLLYLIDENYKSFLFCFVGGYTLAIYSHLAMSIYFTIIILLTFFTVYFKKIFTKKNIAYLFFSAILILLLTSSFWMPMLEIKLKGSYGIFMPYYITGKGDLRFSAISALELINYLNSHTYDFIRFNLQLFVVIMFIRSIYLIFKNKMWKEKIWVFLMAFTLLSIIMITSLFPWYYTPDILQTLQFPWRLVIYVAFGAILIAGVSLKQIEDKQYFNKICIALIIISLFASHYYTYHTKNSAVDLDNIDYNLGVGNQAEYLPEKTLTNMDYYENRENDIVILSGLANIEILLNDVPDLNFKVTDIDDYVTIELPRLYYMGYNLECDGQDIEITESDKGFLQATINNNGEYHLTYEKTTIMKVSKTISIGTFIAIIAVIIYKHIKQKKYEYKEK